MKSVFRWISRHDLGLTLTIYKIFYFIIDLGIHKTEYCRICGHPISRNGIHSTFLADAEILDLKMRSYYIYPICQHCRKTRTQETVYNAYWGYWTDLFRYTDKLEFTWEHIRKAIKKDRKENLYPGEIRVWKKLLKKAWKESTLPEAEYCGFPKGKEIKELISAAESFNNRKIIIEKSDTRTSIKLIRHGKKETQESIIYLPDTSKSREGNN